MLTNLLDNIVTDNDLHCKWLNTLSFMENVGSRKISACQDKVFVKETILKHAAEEARHAYFLKKQISKLNEQACPTYEFKYMLSPISSYQYLSRLDTTVCKYLKDNLGINEAAQLKYIAYLFVTYLIEVRAGELYPVYQQSLDKHQSKVNVKSIIAEEEAHLAEMQNMLNEHVTNWKIHAKNLLSTETFLYTKWLESIVAIKYENNYSA